jgi:hypothetical protein
LAEVPLPVKGAKPSQNTPASKTTPPGTPIARPKDKT